MLETWRDPSVRDWACSPGVTEIGSTETGDNNLPSGHGILYRKDKMIAEEDWKGGCFMSDKECVISVLVPESACR